MCLASPRSFASCDPIPSSAFSPRRLALAVCIQQFNLIKLDALNGLEEGATVNFDSLRAAGKALVFVASSYLAVVVVLHDGDCDT